jgi:hypothetical protein
MDADACPHVGLAFCNGDDVAPFALPGGDVEEAANAPLARVFKHFRLPLHQALVIEMAMAID